MKRLLLAFIFFVNMIFSGSQAYVPTLIKEAFFYASAGNLCNYLNILKNGAPASNGLLPAAKEIAKFGGYGLGLGGLYNLYNAFSECSCKDKTKCTCNQNKDQKILHSVIYIVSAALLISQARK